MMWGSDDEPVSRWAPIIGALLFVAGSFLFGLIFVAIQHGVTP
jgi:hypothetical protein